MTKDNWRVTADRMRFDDIDLLRLSNRERRKLIGHNVSMIFQEPQSCLDPSERIGQQLIQSIPGWTSQGPLVATSGLAQAPGHRAVAPRRH